MPWKTLPKEKSTFICLFTYVFIYLLPYDAVMSSNSIVSNVHNEFESFLPSCDRAS